MKRIISLFLLFSLLTACTRGWDNPLTIDEDLKNTPNIAQINLDSDNNVNIILDYAYSDTSVIVLERKSIGGFETVNYVRKTQIILVDTLLDKEIDQTFIYRFYVKKDKYRSSYSTEKQFSYPGAGLNEPQDLTAISLELQGIRLEWKDKSNHEESYKIEKNEGSGFNALATVQSNSVSYFDAISGISEAPLQLMYRIKAIKSDLESDWVDVTAIYTGIGSPANLEISNSSPANFKIQWQDNSNIESGYSVERKKGGDSYVIINQVGVNITSYTDKISETGTYFYRVRAIKDDTYSTYSNEVSQEILSLIPTDGLVAYYPFNGNANDESGNGNHGTIKGGATVNGYLVIGNNNVDFVNLPYTILDGLTDFTCSARLKINTVHTSGTTYPLNLCIQGWRASLKEYAFSLSYHSNTSNSWRFGLDNNYVQWSNSTIEDKNWHHVVIERVSFIAKIYIDGIKVGNDMPVSNASINIDPNSLILGQEKDLNGPYDKNQSWAGEMDNFRVYNRALSEDEIQVLFNEDNLK